MSEPLPNVAPSTRPARGAGALAPRPAHRPAQQAAHRPTVGREPDAGGTLHRLDPSRLEELRNPSTLLHNLTDLFVAHPAPASADILRFEDMALRLAPKCDARALIHVAATLAAHPHAPAAVIDALARLDERCAIILAEHCPKLDPRLILEFAQGADPAPVAAIARRPALTRELALVLSKRTEPHVLRSLAANPAVALEGPLLERLVKAGRDDPELAALLLERLGDPAAMQPLFAHAPEQMRREILRAADRAACCAARIRDMRMASPAVLNWLPNAASAGNWNGVARELARLFALPAAQILTLIRSAEGDGLALALAGVGVPAETAMRLFAHIGPEHPPAPERLAAMAWIMENIPAHTACTLVTAIAGDRTDENAKRAGASGSAAGSASAPA